MSQEKYIGLEVHQASISAAVNEPTQSGLSRRAWNPDVKRTRAQLSDGQ